MDGNPLDDYFAALERLKKGTSKKVPKGTRITNDAVALEAGRGKGSIKKSRLVFADLIAAIEEAARAQAISLYITRPAGPPVQVFFDKSH